jgi:NADH:ubiquinone oxidoreductase subunit C
MFFLYKFNIQSYIKSKVKKNSNYNFRYNSIKAFNVKPQFVKFFPTRFFYCVNGENVVKLKSKDIIPFFTFLKYHTGTVYSQLIDITAVDHPERKQRFEVIYQLLSVFYNQRLSVSVYTSEGKSLESITSIYSSAG